MIFFVPLFVQGIEAKRDLHPETITLPPLGISR
jgi:hypothetical protein